MPKRCALGCPFTSQSYHQFPHPYRNPERFKAWVHIAGGKLDCEEDIELFRKKVVCDIHFTDKDKNRNNRLNFLAVPSLHLSGKSNEVGSSEKVLLVPEPANEENSPAVSTPTVIGRFDKVGTSEKVLLAPKPLNEESGLATLKPAVTASQSYHQFPHPYRNPERFKAWVHIAGGRLDCEEDIELFRKKVVCDIHFTDKDKNRNNRLNFLAVPSLHLSGKSDEVGSSEKVILVPEPANEENSPAVSTPTVIVRFDEVGTSEKVLLAPKPLNEESGLAKLKPAVTDHCAGIIASEHSYGRREKKQKKSTHQQLEVQSLWLNELKRTRRKIKILQSTLIRSQKKNKSLQSRIAHAEKMSTDILLKKLTANMTIAARIFTKMQYSQTSKKPSGRRFSLEEKVLSLSLYKKCPKSYPLLAKYFTLPSAKSLKRLDENRSRS